ncbi:hypothetical protein SELMODRAFT_146421 [Selaginella moellendorffii]|uniref:t-SNARE coiled-coil homology domain-containing protein n=1 Tax=Selaginella moellendorffii TaxID=88036 RepID=D8REG6_SELML|nr:vesicle transport v-SNARE 11 [Selaginella moellendorffii]XP_024531552.1 vesicle transport v-SNARE 11 [Selaginella moellendorffii]EFJ28012.1 hypothetical protein SELMODRAFT_270868 [Selaginella moellendorffii]EFJ29443.1 hypothetical protein SELMODRAFT_146421 [Selaginella moellendorffii]|eukprot:XP_002969355.1 vesicle transport v-SNARE 11 [Selaginella moellendorffii]
MSEIFDGYERQYCELSTNLARRCSATAILSGEEKKQKLAELKSGLDEAQSLIQRMELEARSLGNSQKAVFLAKLREYKSDLTSLKKDVQKCATTDALAAREELLEAGLGDLSTSTDQRGRLLYATDKMNRSGERIKESKRTLLETEDLGVSILQDLHDQRQRLLHTRDTLYGVDDNVGKSRKILNSMARRINQNKWIMGGLISFLIAAILLVAYFKWVSK